MRVHHRSVTSCVGQEESLILHRNPESFGERVGEKPRPQSLSGDTFTIASYLSQIIIKTSNSSKTILVIQIYTPASYYQELCINGYLTLSLQQRNKSRQMLAKVPLRQHQPQEIYAYLQSKYTPIKMKIKKGYAIITLPSQLAYNEVLEKLTDEKLFGKKLEFSRYTPGQELSLQEKNPKNNSISLMDQQRPQKQQKFHAQNQVDKLIIESHLQIQQRIDDAFEKLIHLSRDRVNKLNLEIKQIDPRNREVKALADGVKKKLQEVENKFITVIKKVFSFIDTFTTKPTEIQIEPTFKINDEFKFPQISIDNCEFLCDRRFTNPGNSFCKRLCALNSNQFVVSGHDQAYITKGFVKIFDVNQSHHKQAFQIEDGASGLCILNSVIIAGTAFGTALNTINLEDDKREPESSGNLLRKHQKAGSQMIEIKRISTSASCSFFVTLCKDNVIRQYEMKNQEIMTGVISSTFQEKYSLDIGTKCRSLEILKENVMVYGIQQRVIKVHLESQRSKQINLRVKGLPFRIKRCNDNQLAIAIGETIYIVDNRSETIVQNFVGVGDSLISIQPITDHCIFFGTHKKIGMMDDRRSQFIRWSDQKSHRGSISDIIRLENRIVSCDIHGNIYSWKLAN